MITVSGQMKNTMDSLSQHYKQVKDSQENKMRSFKDQ
jgi:hypothetical protein